LTFPSLREDLVLDSVLIAPLPIHPFPKNRRQVGARDDTEGETAQLQSGSGKGKVWFGKMHQLWSGVHRHQLTIIGVRAPETSVISGRERPEMIKHRVEGQSQGTRLVTLSKDK
jgi:hypothetical protein